MRTYELALGRAARIMTGAVLALAASAAAAQELELAALHELDDDRTDIVFEGLTVDQLEDLDVIRDGTKIGEIDAVLASGDEIVALVLDYDGALPGLGDREVVVPIGEFELVEGRREAQLSLTDEELAGLQVWDD